MAQRHDFWRGMQVLTQVSSIGAFALTVWFGLPVAGAPGMADAGVRQEAAMAAYQAGHWAQAYQALSSLADDGDAEAARMAGLMVRQGPVLFGRRFEASREQLAAWARLVGQPAPTAPLRRTEAGRDGAEPVQGEPRAVASR